MRRIHVAIGLVVIGLCVVLWLVLAGRGASESSAAQAAADEARPSEAELIAANREPPPAAPAPAAAAPPRAPTLTPQWLAGTWRPVEDHRSTDPDAPCETDVVTTFFADGRYADGDGSTGRFRMSGDEIVFFDQVMREMGSDEEDLSEFDRENRVRIEPIDQNNMRIDGEKMRRCSIG